jgi:putative methionine-R-sulfoxide reductase with GAF domain
MAENVETAVARVPNRIVQEWIRWSINPGLVLSTTLLGIVLWCSLIDPLPIFLWAALVTGAVFLDGLASPTSIISRWRYNYGRKKSGHPLYQPAPGSSLTLSTSLVVLDHDLFQNQPRLRWVLLAFVVGLFWGFTAWIGWTYPPQRVNLLFVFALLLGFAIIPYSLMVPNLYDDFDVAKSAFFWVILPLLGLVPNAILYSRATGTTAIVLITAALLLMLHFFAYALQRFRMGERVHLQIVLDISRCLLDAKDPLATLHTKVPHLLQEKMRYQRVFILEPNPARTELIVTGQAGTYPDLRQITFPSDAGISGHVFTSGEAHYFNDVGRCDYYHDASGDDYSDDTRSEIAVPIIHQRVVYGVLDVEDNRAGAYRDEDRRTLEVIAQLLGAVIAADASEKLMEEARKRWQTMSHARATTEEAVFLDLTGFALDSVGAHAAIYWPFTPSGFPAGETLVRQLDGKLERLRCQGSGCAQTDPLIVLTKSWLPLFDDGAEAEPGLLAALHGSHMLLPVGAARDRFGVLILLFHEPRSFTSLFRATTLSLTQAFANVLALVRYRTIFFSGIGRPELGIHDLTGFYGLKVDVLSEAETLLRDAPIADSAAFPEHKLYDLLRRISGFMDAVTLARTTLPPDFWAAGLRHEIELLASKLPQLPDGRLPTLTITAFDPRVEYENAWTKLALYRLVVEATQNALRHGKATRIDITLARSEDCYCLEVRNNGRPIPDYAAKNKSKDGIFWQMERLGADFRAEASLTPAADNPNETLLRVKMPYLEVQWHEEDE